VSSHTGQKVGAIQARERRYLRMVLHGVCVCEEPLLVAPTLHHEPRAGGGVLPTSLPRQGEVGGAVHAVDLHHSVHEASLHGTKTSRSLKRSASNGNFWHAPESGAWANLWRKSVQLEHVAFASAVPTYHSICLNITLLPAKRLLCLLFDRTEPSPLMTSSPPPPPHPLPASRCPHVPTGHDHDCHTALATTASTGIYGEMQGLFAQKRPP